MADNTIDASMHVRDMAARFPETKPVFQRFGLDTCCGGGAPIADAARRDGVNLDELIQALRGAILAT